MQQQNKPNINLPKFRIGALNLKEFYALKQVEKDAYIEEVKTIPTEQHGETDKYILQFYCKKTNTNKNFFSLD